MNDGCVCDDSSRPRLFDNALSGDPSDDFCAEAVSCTGGSINEMNECICGSGEVIVGGACLANEDAASCEDYEKFVNADSGTGGACLPQVAGDCAAIANQMFVPEIENGVEIGGVCECDALYVRDANDNTCRLPSGNAECVSVNPSEPIHDDTEADNCRAARDLDDCETGQAFTAQFGCRSPMNGQQCEDAKDTSYVGIDQIGTCVSSCTSPNVLNSEKVCGPPASDGECATLYGGTRPKHDSSATDNCRALTDAECAPQVSDATINGNCRDRVVGDCPNDDDYLDGSGGCATAMTGQQCRDAKNPVAPDAVYESAGGAGCVAANACAEDRQPNAEHTCAPPSEAHCRTSMEVADGNSCRAPMNGAECATATGDAARNAYDDSFTGAARCRASCSASRELRTEPSMNNICTDRQTADCASDLFLDVADNRTCRAPTTGEECEQRNGGMAGDLLDNAVCRTAAEGCSGDRVADTNGVCQNPTQADCLMQTDGRTYLPTGAVACRAPANGTECAEVDSATGFYDSETSSCVASCTSSQETEANNVCDNREEEDCPSTQYFDEADNRACKTPTQVSECSLVRAPIPNAVFEDNACAANCRTGTDRQPVNSVCQPPSDAHCRLTMEVVDGDSCVAPDSGTDCRTAHDDNGYFYDPVDMMCKTDCGNGRIGPAPDFNCRALAMTDCTTEPNIYFDNSGSFPRCRPPITGEECRASHGGGMNEVYESETGMCQASCEGTRVPSSDSHTCVALGQSTCDQYYDSADDECRAPENGDECIAAGAGDVYDDSFPAGDECQTACSASRERRTDMNNDCTDRTRDDCNNDQYLDEADNRTCKTPTLASQCSQVKVPITDAVFDNGACAASCGGHRVAEAGEVCQDPTQGDCSARMDGLTFLPAGATECRAPADSDECETATGNPESNFYDTNLPGNCGTACSPSREPDADNACEDRTLDDCNNGQYLDAADNRTCKTPTEVSQCSQVKDAFPNPVFESGACAQGCNADRQPDADSICQPPSDAHCLLTREVVDGNSCVFPRNGNECDDTTRGVVYDNSFTGDDRCRAACSASRERRTDMNNDCTDRTRDDCNDNQYLDTSDNRTCKVPTLASQCSQVKAPITDAVFEGGACAAECNGHRVAEAGEACQDPMQDDCSARTDGLTFLPAGATECRAFANGEECRMANAGEFFDEDASPSCVDTVPAGEVCPETENYNCRPRALSDCENGQFLDATDMMCKTPDTGSECRLERQGETRDQTLVYESEAAGGADCVSSCTGNRVQDAEFTCQDPTGLVCAEENQAPNADGDECVCIARHADSDTTTEELTCTLTPTCTAPEILNMQTNSCRECEPNQHAVGGACVACGDDQVRAAREASCSCREGYADSDTTTAELTCTLTPACDGTNEGLDMQTNSCECTTGDRQNDGTCAPNIECNEANQERNPDTNMCRCERGNNRQADNSCAPNIECPDPNEVRNASTNTCIASSDCTGEGMRIQGNGECEADIVCNEANQERDPADNTCRCERGNVRQTDGSCAEGCANTQKLLEGACVALTSSDCLPAEKFDDDRCVLLAPEDGAALTPPYGDYTAATCTEANWPWSIVQTADGLSEICHAPVNLLATEVPSSQTLNDAGGQLDFCVLRGAESGDSVRCDDPTVFGSLGIPMAPEGLDLVTQTTATITITLSDGSIREATTLTVAVARYLQVVHSGGSVAAIFPPDTATAQITTATALVGTISLEMPDPGTMSVTPPLATNTVTPPAAGGGGGGGGGAAAALIAVPVVLLGGYWLLGGFEFIDPTYNLSYSGENDDLTYTGQGGFQLNHGNLHSFAQAIQSDGEAVAYQSGISYKEDFYSLNYAAYESKSIYDYDLRARLTYGDGPWSISPTADAEFHYSANTEDWTSEAGAGLTAAWTSHKWNVRAHSAFAGDLNHGLDVEFRF